MVCRSHIISGVDFVLPTLAIDKFPANHRLPSSRDPSCTTDVGKPFCWVHRLRSQPVGPKNTQHDRSWWRLFNIQCVELNTSLSTLSSIPSTQLDQNVSRGWRWAGLGRGVLWLAAFKARWRWVVQRAQRKAETAVHDTQEKATIWYSDSKKYSEGSKIENAQEKTGIFLRFSMGRIYVHRQNIKDPLLEVFPKTIRESSLLIKGGYRPMDVHPWGSARLSKTPALFSSWHDRGYFIIMKYANPGSKQEIHGLVEGMDISSEIFW